MNTIILSPDEPAHVRAAPSHRDPSAYYSRLAQEQHFFHDEANGWWVAASAAAVKEVLTSRICLTRPLSEPIPEALLGGAAGQIFGRLVRLRDDDAGDKLRRAVASALRGVDLGQVAVVAHRRAMELDSDAQEMFSVDRTMTFMFALPVQVVAQLLGIPKASFGDVMAWLGDYGAAAAAAATGIPALTAELLARGHHGAQALFELVMKIRRDSQQCGPLLHALANEARRVGCDDETDVVVNAIGYLVQGYVAMASLIGSTLLALARQPALRTQVVADPTLVRPLIQEVLRCDPVTNSTFRFMARDGKIAGHMVRQGEMIIVLLAAANRDPALNPDPDRFDITRADRKFLEFGAGVHACPAEKFAPLLVEVAVAHLLRRGLPFEQLESSLTYAASGHVRTPLFKR
ncbi:cytochrome P450 [Ensifer sp. T173]|uniref:Cytochrome P450 n=1 Tax=Ensifer canadensis TaxID=555315 RepID=A0AAW4FW78_9HYPH|nr:cytochrome P450 [Ensifer canadensis]MBM3095372.1 cytochrome P450 [Ensifer canadensis]UBI77782.1 cytochrome P450 [Ensifer canadensis]